MSDEVLVKVEGASKKFCRSLKRSLWYGVSDIAHDLNPFASGQRTEIREQKSELPSDLRPLTSGLSSGLPSDLRPLTSESPCATARDEDLRAGEFYAVRDVSFELKRGECLGLIGRNGAGKTTLLKMLNGLIKPDAGRIEMRGRVGALIALGAGFNPILTGRENIYVNGSVLGLSKREIDGKLEEIIDFADIREFIDTPVQSYSSGMQVRLGFAIATALKPDVLLLDEVLAVGDARFQAKCYQRLGSVLENAAVILVSHQAYHIQKICDSAILLEKGHLVEGGDPQRILDRYSGAVEMKPSERLQILGEEIAQAEFMAATATVTYGGELEVVLTVTALQPVGCDQAYLNIVDAGEVVHAQVILTDLIGTVVSGTTEYRLLVGPLFLSKGQFKTNLLLLSCGGKKTLVHLRNCFAFQAGGPVSLGAYYYPPARIKNVVRSNS